MKDEISIRFHLALGKNYQKWRVEDPDGTITFYEPADVQLTMLDARLTNRPAAAKKIFEGAHKAPIAFVKCKKLYIAPANSYAVDVENVLLYNPKIAPNWHDLDKNNLDNCFYPKLISNQRRIYTANNLIQLQLL